MLLFLLVVASYPASSEELSSELGLALTPVAPWVADAGESLDSTLAFQLRLPSQDATFTIRRSPEAARSLRGLWEGLRYTVVVEQGGAILKDEQIKVAGAPGRQLIYETFTTTGSERHLEINVLLKKELVVMVFDAPAQIFDNNLASVRTMATSLRLVSPAVKP